MRRQGREFQVEGTSKAKSWRQERAWLILGSQRRWKGLKHSDRGTEIRGRGRWPHVEFGRQPTSQSALERFKAGVGVGDSDLVPSDMI